MGQTINTADYMSITEAATALSRSRFTIRDWYKALPGEEPKLNAVRVGRQVLISRASVAEQLAISTA